MKRALQLVRRISIAQRLWKDDSGQDLVEYGLLLVLIALVAAAALPAIGTALKNLFSATSTCLQTPSTGCAVAPTN